MEPLWSEYLRLLVACVGGDVGNKSPDWTAILSMVAALLAAITSGIAANIALKQAHLAHEQARISLFEKRFRVYEAWRKTAYGMSNALTNDSAAEISTSYYPGVWGYEWLFGSDITDYLSKEFEPRLKEWFNPTSGTRQDLQRWFLDESTQMCARFSPYLSFSDIRQKPPRTGSLKRLFGQGSRL
ncbi:MAG: hypothetical protein K2X78_01255 [Burkholderiaceae bacterium]|nr:hypothetical protein [Burkholderiaceae bacterium]